MTNISATPIQSSFARVSGSLTRTFMNLTQRRTHSSPMGTLMKKMYDQCTVVRMPPTAGPKAVPHDADSVTAPMEDPLAEAGR